MPHRSTWVLARSPAGAPQRWHVLYWGSPRPGAGRQHTVRSRGGRKPPPHWLGIHAAVRPAAPQPSPAARGTCRVQRQHGQDVVHADEQQDGPWAQAPGPLAVPQPPQQVGGPVAADGKDPRPVCHRRATGCTFTRGPLGVRQVWALHHSCVLRPGRRPSRQAGRQPTPPTCVRHRRGPTPPCWPPSPGGGPPSGGRPAGS